MALRELLFPQPPRNLRFVRGINIASRTLHVVAAGILLGGHFFGIKPDKLESVLIWCVATGILLLIAEVLPTCRWFELGSGVMFLVKLVVLLLVPVFWEWRVLLLIAVAAIASVGAHMPAKFRHYSLVERKAMDA